MEKEEKAEKVEKVGKVEKAEKVEIDEKLFKMIGLRIFEIRLKNDKNAAPPLYF